MRRALGCLNLHGSLLPRWRGAAPIQRAVLAGDARTGVMVMQMDEGLDTGPVGAGRRDADRPRHDHRRAARQDDAGRRRPDGPGAGGAGARLADLHAAARRRRHLRQEDREGRGADRLEQAGGRGAQPHPRHVAVSRRVVRARARRRGDARSRRCARRWPTGSGAPGTILPDLTIACGERRRAARRRCSAKARPRWTPRRSCAGQRRRCRAARARPDAPLRAHPRI